VYKAFDQSLKRWVALKVPALDQDPPSERRRIRSEAESMAQLEHRHIVRVFDVSDEGSDTVISMELIAGGSLQEHLSTFVRDPSGTARLMVALARGVHHAHQRGILHRDLKPSNVLLGRDEDGTFHPYVSDFGLAKPIPVTAPPHQPGPGPETVAYGRIVGTASYMSCEQAAGSPATTLSDVYGLGGILYAMLTGRPPFRGETAAEILALARDPFTRPASPSTLNPHVDRTLEAICLRCLEKDPDRRYRSAEGLARDLDHWLAHRPTDARRLGALGRGLLWCRRSPVAAGLVLAVLALAGMAAAEIVDRLGEPRRARLATAQQTAALLVSRLADLQGAVAETARHPALGPLLRAGDRPALQAFIEAEGDRHDDLNGRSPFETVFVLDGRSGDLLAEWPVVYAETAGIDFRRRDYYQGLLTSPGTRPHVSRVFRSVTDRLFKFGVSAPITIDGQIVGAVVATVTTDDRMGLPAISSDTTVTAVLAALDPNPLPGEVGNTQPNASDYVVFLHPAYESGIEPVWLPGRYVGGLTGGEFTDFEDPVSGLPGGREFAGKWVATFVPVDGTPFVVMVQQR
jgi:serine/threonine-protein kinase